MEVNEKDDMIEDLIRKSKREVLSVNSNHSNIIQSNRTLKTNSSNDDFLSNSNYNFNSASGGNTNANTTKNTGYAFS